MKKQPIRIISTVLIIVLISLAAFTLAACSKTYSFEDKSFTYEKTKGSSVEKKYTGYYTSTDYSEYYFDAMVSKSDRNKFVNNSESILEKLELTESKLKIFVSPEFYTRANAAEKSVHFNPNDLRTIKHISFIIQALSSETVNFGLLYGVSNIIFQELSFGNPTYKTDDEIKAFLTNEENRFILDLNYAVFNKKFSSEDQIFYAESISSRLANFINEKHGKNAFEELFTKALQFDLAFEKAFSNYLNEYLGSIGIAARAEDSVVLRASSYDSYYPIRLYTVSCNYYINTYWDEKDIQEVYMSCKDFVLTYSSLKEFLVTMEDTYAEIRKFFAIDEIPWLAEVLMFNRTGAAGHAVMASHTIELRGLHALPHEYVHIMTYYYGRTQSWLIEGMASYLAAIFDQYYINDCKYIYENYKDLDLLDHHYLPMDYLNALGRDFDVRDYVHYGVYFTNFYYGRKYVDPQDGYSIYAIGFSDYLVETYGVEKYIELYLSGSDYMDTFGKSQNAMINQYLDWLEMRFQQKS